MRWITHILNIIFPAPVSARDFETLPSPVAHRHMDWILSATSYRGLPRHGGGLPRHGDGVGERIVRYLKETPDRTVAGLCARVMVASLESFLIEEQGFQSYTTLILIPIPLHPKDQRMRGFNQSFLLAKEMNRLAPALTVQTRILTKIRRTEKQALLGRQARLKNIRGAFSVESAIEEGALYILVDDVSTTGSTLDEARRVLYGAGAKHVIGLVFAH